jgi:hypothetical protein
LTDTAPRAAVPRVIFISKAKNYNSTPLLLVWGHTRLNLLKIQLFQALVGIMSLTASSYKVVMLWVH